MGLMFEIKVTPQSKKQGFSFDKGQHFKCALTITEEQLLASLP